MTLTSDPVLGGGVGDVPNCSRGGRKLRSNMGAKVNIDVEERDGPGNGNGDEDGDKDENGNGEKDEDEDEYDEDEDGDAIDKMFDQMDEGGHGNEEPSSRLVRPVTRPIQETQVLSTATIHLLSTLAGSCRAVTSSNATVFNNASDVFKSLVNGHSWDSIQSAFQVNSLLAIAQRCHLSERLVESSQVIFSLNLIQFRTKIES